MDSCEYHNGEGCDVISQLYTTIQDQNNEVISWAVSVSVLIYTFDFGGFVWKIQQILVVTLVMKVFCEKISANLG